MPITVTETTGADVYASPFIGPVDNVIHMKIDVSSLLVDGAQGAQVDAKGYLKPGVLLAETGGVGVPPTGSFVKGVVIEATKLVAANPTNATLGADTSDPFIAVATSGVLNRDIIEDNLGRALHADELAALVAAGSNFTITTT